MRVLTATIALETRFLALPNPECQGASEQKRKETRRDEQLEIVKGRKRPGVRAPKAFIHDIEIKRNSVQYAIDDGNALRHGYHSVEKEIHDAGKLARQRAAIYWERTARVLQTRSIADK